MFRDPSIGTAINIVLVRVMILKENPVRNPRERRGSFKVIGYSTAENITLASYTLTC